MSVSEREGARSVYHVAMSAFKIGYSRSKAES